MAAVNRRQESTKQNSLRINKRRGVRVVEGARLESVYTRKGIAGSNPAFSADQIDVPRQMSGAFLFWSIAELAPAKAQKQK